MSPCAYAASAIAIEAVTTPAVNPTRLAALPNRDANTGVRFTGSISYLTQIPPFVRRTSRIASRRVSFETSFTSFEQCEQNLTLSFPVISSQLSEHGLFTWTASSKLLFGIQLS
jgi:hypothetical protein